MKWKDKLLNEFITQLGNRLNGHDEIIIAEIVSSHGIGVHLAIFNEPFLSAIIKKRKTIESRFSINRLDPFRRVYEGDIVLIKKSPGNIIGYFKCGKIEYWNRNQKLSFDDIEKRYGANICTSLDDDFWKNREHSRFGTLIEIKEIHFLREFGIGKQDRTAWTVLKERNKPSIFDFLPKF